MSFLSEAGAYKVTRSVKILRGTKALFKIEVTYDELFESRINCNFTSSPHQKAHMVKKASR